ncbi:hypothetical protein DPMN_090357 [Dreissena polymorpha]|uniref:Uncharacterized protein n=1 Tax=Dreissena polymorpha TaxID=45954 RepID=A0A9D4KY36_DREPO|nr:hypothetical protein DPMN_090357 [Dreissena polymorpha]
MEKGDSYTTIAESYVDSEKGITDKRHWGSMATKTSLLRSGYGIRLATGRAMVRGNGLDGVSNKNIPSSEHFGFKCVHQPSLQYDDMVFQYLAHMRMPVTDNCPT